MVTFLLNPSMYRQPLDSLNCLTITQPDNFVVQQVNQFMQAPQQPHLVVQLILHYLKGIFRRGLFFSTNKSLQLIAYNNAD